MKKRVVVGLSGGVDSSVAAWLLKEQGYDVMGVTMELLHGQARTPGKIQEDGCGPSAAEDARRVAEALNIPFYVMDFQEVFQKHVITPFISAYCSGCTPNPCVLCNRYVKWEALLKRGMELGADYIATGHYARIKRLPNGRLAAAASATAAKDQTYALYNLTQEQLSRTLMPVGEYRKEEIREIAARLELPVAHKPDSQEICFIPDQDYAGYIQKNADYQPHPGCFVDLQGRRLGQHRGIIHYTVGQRKGLGIAFGQPMYVVQIRPETNEVVLGTNEETFGDTLYGTGINYMGLEAFQPGERLLAKIRYRHRGDYCRVYPQEEGVKCVFERPQRAITPGQAVVFYREDYVAGGGTIVSDGRFS